MTAQPFLIFPWDKPFLPQLHKTLCALSHGRPGRCAVIVPHNRPRRYLTELFRQDAALPRPLLLPRMLTVAEMIGLFRAQTTDAPLHTAGSLDRVALLYQCVRDVADASGDAVLCRTFASMDMARFFPWGLRLAGVLEECLTQLRDARDIPYAEEEVSPLAAALLGALGRIQTRYLELLEQRRWTTPGLDAHMAARHAAAIPPLLAAATGGIFVAGLAVLSNAENRLLRRLWEHGAHICLHTDPALADPENTGHDCHWACADHARWIKEWRAPCAAACPPSGNRPRLHFLAGYDAHSQLDAVRAVLERDAAVSAAAPNAIAPTLAPDATPATAVVLTDPGLLMPTLHHLPARDFNVSMGYPLERAPLCRLLESVLRLHATRRAAVSPHPAGPDMLPPDMLPPDTASPDSAAPRCRYHWRALLHCLRHPYLHMLGATATQETPLREVFARMEERLRGGSRFADPWELAREAADWTGLSPALRQVLEAVLTCLADSFAAAATPADMADAIARLCDLLLTHGGDTWKRYPLDAESLYRLVQGVIPELKGSALAHTPFPQSALFSLTRQLVRVQRVPFEADPIAGLQVLGMLETRLLHFERLLIVDATDDKLPGFTAQDPLLPDALRALLGLPDARRRERTAAHTLYRLMAGATEAYLFWQEGVQHSGLFDGKKARSRFVEEFLWQEERRRKALLAPGTPPLETAACPVRPVPRRAQGVDGCPELRAAVRDMLTRGISPTRMDAYLTCPARFARESLLRLRPLEEVNEGDDPAAVGQLIHEVLRAAYAPRLHRPLRKGDISRETLCAQFSAALEASPLRAQLPPASYIMLAAAGPLRLSRYLEHQPEETCVVALEHPLAAPICQGRYHVKGTLDRVDRRHGRLTVLDYKTGRVQPPPSDIWSDTALWRTLALWTPESAHDPLPDLAQLLPSVQLPCYIYLCAASTLGDPANAAWVNLRDDGKEIPLLDDAVDEDLRDAVVRERIPQLLDFVLRHMAHAAVFPPREGGHCGWCPYAPMCMRGW